MIINKTVTNTVIIKPNYLLKKINMKKIYFLSLAFLSFSAFAQDPATNAPTPNYAPGVVQSVYSNASGYGNRASTNFNESTGRATQTGITVSGNNILKYNFTAGQGFYTSIVLQPTAINASTSTFLHIDVFTPTGGKMTFKIIDYGADNVSTAPNQEAIITPATFTQGVWNSYDIDLSTVTFKNNVWKILIQGTGAFDYYIDNIYFRSANTLPLTLTSFTGKTGNSGADLSWTTASEENFNGFEIQRRSDDSEFSKTAFIAGGKSNYNFTDLSPLNGNNYYRLKMIDNDGTFKYSEVVAVKYTLSSNQVTLSVYPNPVTDILNLSFNAETMSKALATLVDVQGRTVKAVSFEANTGTNTATINVADVNSGSYFLNVTLNGSLIGTKKIIK